MTDQRSVGEGRIEKLPEGHMSATTRSLATVFVVLCAAFWIFAFSPWARDIFTAPDQLSDDSLATAIDAACADARSSLAELAPARDAKTPAERAETLVESDLILRQMTADLSALSPTDPDDRRLLTLWLADWEIYVADRDTHVQRLLSEGDVRFLTTVTDGGVYINERIDGFARVNDLASCETPGDL